MQRQNKGRLGTIETSMKFVGSRLFPGGVTAFSKIKYGQ